MQRGHAVYAEAIVNVDMGHMDPVIISDNVHGRIFAAAAHLVVQYFHNGNQLGYGFLEEIHGPGFQGLGQDGVVGVGAGAADHVDGIVHFQAVLGGEQADQLRNHHGGMGVVDLDDRVVGQVVVVAALGGRFLQDQAGRVGHHEILLVNAQHPSGAVAVVRIEEEGQVLLNVRLIEGNAVLHHGFVHRFHVKQVELVGAVVVAGHRNVVHAGGQRKTFVGNGVGLVGFGEPGRSFQPGIGLLLLLVVREELFEQAEMVVQSHAVPV